ncbi:jg19465 [Pararge aegeria aegeria]|uniref:Jg19465 protein n=1 Tax=Pararge aegeria aegeria TaxID=348720 RepID=A0A8S4R4P2_9NEOP|nr:jg19465 [Pararge aegeria aegeria]
MYLQPRPSDWNTALQQCCFAAEISHAYFIRYYCDRVDPGKYSRTSPEQLCHNKLHIKTSPSPFDDLPGVKEDLTDKR